MTLNDLAGRVALVTGGGSGIGAACAELLGSRGAVVTVVDLDLAAANSVAARIGGDSTAMQLDVSNAAEVAAVIRQIAAELGPLRIAVNNAGIGEIVGDDDFCTPEAWRQVSALNLDGVFYCSRAEIKAMQAAGRGVIVNMGSIFAAVGAAHAPAYTAAKHGVIGLTRSTALAHASDGIRINAVGPAFIRTPLFEARTDTDAQERLTASVPMQRLGTPREVAELVTWLCSDVAAFVTGAFYPVDGGFLAQ